MDFSCGCLPLGFLVGVTGAQGDENVFERRSDGTNIQVLNSSAPEMFPDLLLAYACWQEQMHRLPKNRRSGDARKMPHGLQACCDMVASHLQTFHARWIHLGQLLQVVGQA